MAILIEEENNRASIVKVFLWLLILIIIAVAGYYIFFAKPQLVEIVVPQNLQSKSIDSLAGINFNPQGVLNGEEFQSLKQYITPPKPGNAGKSNPFAP